MAMQSERQAAYYHNDTQTDPTQFYRVACDPRRSVVVEACAGAGKTWMLVSRILRCLLDGVAPQHILAITFTKKAAGEMRERLYGWLDQFAAATPQDRVRELMLRGMDEAQAHLQEPTLAQLHAHWLESGRGVEIHTIHGWFSRLIKAAPLDVLTELGLPPQLNLIEDQAELWPELWARFLKRLDAGEQQQVYCVAAQTVGAFNVESWLSVALSNRLEIELAGQAGHLDHSVTPLGQWAPQWQAYSHPDQALDDADVVARMKALAAKLGQAKGAMAQQAAAAIVQGLMQQDLSERGQSWRAALLTAQGEPKKRLGDADELMWAQDWLVAWLRACAQHEAHALHGHMVALCRVLLAEYAQLKAERGLADMVDLEMAASKLLTDAELAGWVQERLDAQTQHVLMDEFQDTSPLQWHALRSWLEAYAGAGGGRSGQAPMKVFLVGDPKQSIYRFRRADPRVFEAAKQFVVQGLGGDLLACDHTRRNAPGIVQALNLCMQAAHDAGEFAGYRTHTTQSEGVASVCALPTLLRSAVSQVKVSDQWRDSLTEPRVIEQVSLKQLEARQIARAVAHLIRVEQVPAHEIYVLARKRASLAEVSEALMACGVDCVAPENALLKDTAEARDLLALLDALVSTHHDLSLAHALKSPVFGVSDAELMALALRAREQRGSWWNALLSMAEPAFEGLGIDEQGMSHLPGLWQSARLLRAWHEAVHTMPPHDLLQKIVTESDLRANLAQALGPERCRVAWANVDGLLNLALEIDSGRDATVYRWIRQVKRSVAPVPSTAHADAVQLLTIHGAKGLEADVVFLMDTDAPAGRADSYGLLIDWPQNEQHPRRCAFIRSESNPPPSLAELVEQEQQANRREELNALYVALTRAKSRLVISRVEPAAGKATRSWWLRLTESGAVDATQPWLIAGEVTEAEAPAKPGETGRQGHAHDPAVPPQPTASVGKQVVLQTWPPLAPWADAEEALAGAQAQSTDIQRLGQVVHKVLEWVTLVPMKERRDTDLSRAVSMAARQLALPSGSVDEALNLVKRLLASRELAPWLAPDGHEWAGNEVTLHHEGQTLRMDRLICRASAPEGTGRVWWIVDYKLNHHPQELQAYQTQMARYVRAVRAQQSGDEVRAAFITGAGHWVPVHPD